MGYFNSQRRKQARPASSTEADSAGLPSAHRHCSRNVEPRSPAMVTAFAMAEPRRNRPYLYCPGKPVDGGRSICSAVRTGRRCGSRCIPSRTRRGRTWEIVRLAQGGDGKHRQRRCGSDNFHFKHLRKLARDAARQRAAQGCQLPIRPPSSVQILRENRRAHQSVPCKRVATVARDRLPGSRSMPAPPGRGGLSSSPVRNAGSALAGSSSCHCGRSACNSSQRCSLISRLARMK